MVALAACGDSTDTSEGTDGGPDIPDQTYIPPTPDGNWVLVDLIHTIKQNPNMRLDRDEFNYQGMHGYYRLFDHLANNGYPSSQIQYTGSEVLTPEILEGFKVLFINLVSDDRPDFTQQEIEAIQEFVNNGGGLFLIADHTNVYYHAERLNPLLSVMGVEIGYYTAMDRHPTYAIDGGAWVKIRSFDPDHPVTQGVELATFQTGGPMINTDQGVAFLSENGWGDFWIEDPDAPGFYGNWRLDDDEPTGPLAVVTAGEYGQGRVAIVGDQNALGDEWLFMGDNFELATNIVEWLAKNENANPHLRDMVDPAFYEVGFDLEHTNWNIGDGACSGYFPFYINFNRTPEIIGRGQGKWSGKEDAIVLTNPRVPYTDEEIEALRGHLQKGRTMVVLADVKEVGEGTRQVLEAFIPSVEITGERTLGMSELPAGDADVRTVTSTEEIFEVFSDQVNVSGMKMSHHIYPQGVECPVGIEDALNAMYPITASGGIPLFQTEIEGQRADIAKIYNVEGGELIVFFQDGFWRNTTLGWERQLPTPSTANAHDVQNAFLDWLVARDAAGN